MGSAIKTYPTQIQKIKICKKLPKHSTIHSINKSRTNRSCIVCMKKCKRLLLLPCCLCFLTHSGNKNLYQSYLNLGGVNMITIYLLRDMLLSWSQYTRIYFTKARSSNSWQARSWLDLFQFSLVTTSRGSIPRHQTRSIVTGPSTSGFSSKTDELTLHKVFLQCYWFPS